MTSFHDDYDDGMDSKYYFPAYRLGAPLSVQTANQLGDMAARLNEGVANIEVSALSPEKFEGIPQQHMDEMRRLGKLAGANVSVHAPLIDPAGFTREGWSEEQRRANVRQMKNVIDRSHSLDPDGNIPVNFHSTGGVPGFEWEKGLEGEKRQVIAVDQESGRLAPLKCEEKDYIAGKKVWKPYERLKNLNDTTWDEEKLRLMTYQKSKEEVMDGMERLENSPEALKLKFGAFEEQRSKSEILTPEERERLRHIAEQEELYNRHIGEYETHLISGLNELHHKFKRYYPEGEDKREQLSKIKNLVDRYKKQTDIERMSSKRIRQQLAYARDEEERRRIKLREMERVENEIERKVGKRVDGYNLLQGLSSLDSPPVWKSTDDFSREKTAQTLADVAYHSYDKYEDKAPVIAVENFFPETVLSRADSLKAVLKEGRNEFVDKLVKNKHMSKNEAEKVADKLIGATWDVGHINLLRKSGYSKEDIVKEAKKIAPYVKHIHITDNFGYADTHLAPGMGEVPIKEQLKAIEKEIGREEMDKARAIVESGGFAAEFRSSPFPATLEGMGSALYRYEGPSWADVQSSYASAHYGLGMGDYRYPEQHFNMYKTGFTLPNLPPELGGVGSDRGRFATGGKET